MAARSRCCALRLCDIVSALRRAGPAAATVTPRRTRSQSAAIASSESSAAAQPPEPDVANAIGDGGERTRIDGDTIGGLDLALRIGGSSARSSSAGMSDAGAPLAEGIRVSTNVRCTSGGGGRGGEGGRSDGPGVDGRDPAGVDRSISASW